MSRISSRIETSGYIVNIVKDAVVTIGKQLNVPWVSDFDELVLSENSEESYRLEQFLKLLFADGKFLLDKLQDLPPQSEEELIAKISEEEAENINFAREMSTLRRNLAKKLEASGENLSGLGHLATCLGNLYEVLRARNASPLERLIEENIYGSISERERELAEAVMAYIEEQGWDSIPTGEREESVLCLCQYLYTAREFGLACDLLVDAIDAGVRDPLVYYAYFILGISVGEYEAAMEGYQVAIKEMPVLSLAPDRYEIRSIVGHSRLETLCKGVDTYTKQPVFIKILIDPPNSVRNAIQNCSKLKHQRICDVLNYHEINPRRPCIVVECPEGNNLLDYITEQGPFSVEESIELALQIVGSVAHAHDQGIVHGNISPAQLFWSQEHIKIANFGIFPLGEWPLPMAMGDLQNICYLAPELLNPGASPSMAADVYSLAMTIYFIFTGLPPHPMHPEKQLSAIWPVLLKATERSPESRYQNATELLEDLAQSTKEIDGIAPMYAKGDLSGGKVTALASGEKIVLPKNFSHRENLVYSEKDDADMIVIPEGTFTMGSEERASESPVHEVFLDTFLIDRFPVTNAQYASFLEYVRQHGDEAFCHPDQPKAKDHTPTNWGTREYHKYSGQPDNPIIFIDWWDAWAYAQWAGKSLPTEAQWEKAARGNDQRLYPWGDQPPTEKLSNYANNTGGTSPIGAYPEGASPYGCMDMVGNVWEWCLDTYDNSFYRNSSKKNPVNLADKPSRTLRGGSWHDPATTIRASCRGCWINIVRYAYIGFRCVLNLESL